MTAHQRKMLLLGTLGLAVAGAAMAQATAPRQLARTTTTKATAAKPVKKVTPRKAAAPKPSTIKPATAKLWPSFSCTVVSIRRV